MKGWVFCHVKPGTGLGHWEEATFGVTVSCPYPQGVPFPLEQRGPGVRRGSRHSSALLPFQQKDMVQAKASVNCELCEYVVKELVKLIDNNRTEVCAFPEC